MGSGEAGPWIRLVSARTNQEVSEYERQYEDGSDPKVLDVIDVPVIEPRPAGHQTENWLLDPDCYWTKEGSFPQSELVRFRDEKEPLWIDGHHTYHGYNDKIPQQLLPEVGDSLRLIHVDTLELRVFAPNEAFGNTKRRVQAQFVYAEEQYGLWVTDPIYERRYLSKLDGRYALGPCFLTVSLGDVFQAASYKLVAAIIEAERV